MTLLLLLALAAGPATPHVDALGVPLPDGAIARIGWRPPGDGLGRAKRPRGAPGHRKPVHALAFRRNGDLVSAAAEGCFVWRAGTWEQVGRADRPAERRIRTRPARTFFSPDGQFAVWSGPSPAILVDPTTGRRLGRLEGALDRPALFSLYAFSPDGRQLLQLCPGEKGPGTARLRAWVLPGLRSARDLEVDINAGNAPAQDGTPLKGPRVRLAWSPEGRSLAVTDSGREVISLDGSDGLAIDSLLRRPTIPAAASALSPCGRLLAVAASNELGDRGWVTVYERASGSVRLVLRGHEGRVPSLAFSHDGRWLATGGDDTTILVWDMGGREWGRPEAGADLWGALDDEDAGRAFGAMAHLARNPGEAVALLRKHLKPAPGQALDNAAVQRLIAGLGSDDFEARLRDEQALTEASVRLAPRLEEALRAAPDLEVRLRLRRILRKLADGVAPARLVRAVEVLERLRTPEARKFLRELASGNADALLTQEAKASLARMEKTP